VLVNLSRNQDRQRTYHVTLWRFHATIVAVGSGKYILHIMASSRINVTLSAKQGSFTATCRIRWWRSAIQIPCRSICRRVRVRIARPGTSEVGTREYVVTTVVPIKVRG